MVEIRTIGEATLYLGNCRDILPQLSGVDCMVTDPNYDLSKGGKAKGGAMKGIFAGEVYDNKGGVAGETDMSWDELMKLAYAALADDTQHYVMANGVEIFNARNAALKAGFKLHDLLNWNKGTATMSRWYMRNCEYTLFLRKGAAKTINDPGSAQCFNWPNPTDKHHPTEKPVPLMAHYIRNSTKGGDLVLDPQMGSGSTGVAALQEGRRFIGIEKNSKTFEIACRRIEAERHQGWRG